MVKRLVDIKDEEVWRAFKAHCVRNGELIGDVLLDALKGFLEEPRRRK